jgi:hypothetical protein
MSPQTIQVILLLAPLLIGGIITAVNAERINNITEKAESWVRIYLLTETASFLGRLGSHNLYKEGVKLTLTLQNTEHRKLYLDHQNRFPFLFEKVTRAPYLKIEEERSIEEIMHNGISISNKWILQILHGFGYNPNSASIMVDQDKFLSGK